MFSTVKASVISWAGIAGGALTLLANVQKIFTLADWAHWLSSIWSFYVFGFWRSVFGLFRLHIDPQAVMAVAMSVFVMMIAVGSWLSNRAKPVGREEWLTGWRNIRNRYALIALGLYLASFVAVELLAKTSFVDSVTSIEGKLLLLVTLVALIGVYLTAIFLVLRAWPRRAAIITAIALLFLDQLFYSGSGQLAADPAASQILSSIAVFITSVLATVIVVCLAPPRTFANRLVYVFVGLALLLILNQLSGFGLATTEPGVEPTNPGSTGQGGLANIVLRSLFE
jgi:hypothetical protein